MCNAMYIKSHFFTYYILHTNYHICTNYYDSEKYIAIVESIRTLLPDAAIIADAIVGFPGETEEQFENTLDLMRQVLYSNIYICAYNLF